MSDVTMIDRSNIVRTAKALEAHGFQYPDPTASDCVLWWPDEDITVTLWNGGGIRVEVETGDVPLQAFSSACAAIAAAVRTVVTDTPAPDTDAD